MPIPSAPIMKKFGEDFCERVIPYWMLSNAAQLSGCHLACQIISFHINKYEMKTALELILHCVLHLLALSVLNIWSYLYFHFDKK